VVAGDVSQSASIRPVFVDAAADCYDTVAYIIDNRAQANTKSEILATFSRQPAGMGWSGREHRVPQIGRVDCLGQGFGGPPQSGRKSKGVR
jgi:hypothetical protein